MRAHKLDTDSQSRYTYNTLFKMHKVSIATNDPHLHVGPGEDKKAEDIAKNPDGYDDVSHQTESVMNHLDLLNCLIVTD